MQKYKKVAKEGHKMGKYRPENTKKRKKDAEQHVLRDSSKGTHYIYNARDKNDGPTARRTKQEGERGKEKAGKQKTENRKQESGKNRLQRVHTKGILLTIYYFFRLFSNFFLFSLGSLLIFCYLCTQKQQNMIFF